MTTSQFFVYRRPIAWTLLFGTLAWGAFAYTAMPQRQDPLIQIRSGVVLTIYPGANPVEVEQEVTRKVEKRLTESPAVERVQSISRRGLSVVFVDLFPTVKDAEPVWQDLDNKLAGMTDLPTVGGRPLRPALDKDFGDTVAVLLTLSSPPVSDFEIEQRAGVVRRRVEEHRSSRPDPLRDRRYSGVLIHPSHVPDALVERLGRSLLAHLDDRGLAEDGAYLALLGAGVVDFRLPAGRSEGELKDELIRWDRQTIGSGMLHPDVWPGAVVGDPATLADELTRVVRRSPAAVGRYSYKQLRDFADTLQDRLRQSPNVGKIEQVGVQEEAVYLLYSNHRLTALGLDPATLAGRLDQRNINLPGGSLELPGQNLAVKPSGEFASEADVADVVIDAARPGYPLYVRDVADVVRGYEDPPRALHYRTVKDGDGPEGEPTPLRSITLAIRHIKGTQIADFDHDLDRAIASLRGVLPDDLRIERTSDEPHQVERKVEQFLDCFFEAVVIVVIVALLFMEWRSALLVAASIPLATAMTLGMCHMIGIDLQQISIAALIIALGLLVDDPVVASDAINRELAHGVPRDVAAWLGPQKLSRAILYATLTNIVAFLPLLLVTGEVGEFIFSLPVVVTASLIASRVVSMTFMPLLGYYFLKGQRGFEAGLADGGGSRFARAYNGFSEWCLDHKWLTLASCLIALVAACSLVPRIGSAFFPKDLHNVFAVNLFLPEGTPIRETRDEAARAIREIEALAGPEIEAYTTFVGEGGPRFWLSVVPEQPAPNYAQILVHTRDAHATTGLAARLKAGLAPRISAARVTVEQLESGPPIGVPVQLRIFGPEIERLRVLAEQVKGEMRGIAGTDNIHDDWEPDALQIALEVQTDRANLAGVSHQDIATVLDASLSGFTPTYLRERDRLIPVTLRLRPDERSRMDDLTTLSVYGSASGARMPLDQIARFEPELVPPKIGRRDNERCLVVKCDVVPGQLPSRVVAELERRLETVAGGWPAGYRFQFGGEKEEQDAGFASMSVAMTVSVLAIYLALVLQFNSVTKPLVVFAAVPFGLVAGLMGLLIFDVPVGFMAALGLSSLVGVIVSHVIVLFEYIEEAHERGEPVRKAVIDAALVRLRPVLVTVLATVGGLIPLVIKGGPLWEPMCYVQIIGLLTATLVTKVIVPVLYVVFVEDLKLIPWSAPGAHVHEGPPAEYAHQGHHHPAPAPARLTIAEPALVGGTSL